MQMTSLHRRLAAGGAALAVAIGCLVYGITASSSPPGPASPPWRALWIASFAGPPGAGVNPRVWLYRTGKDPFGAHEVAMMSDSASNVHVDGHGALNIVVTGHGAGSDGGVWTSGRIQTRRLFEAPAGGEMLVTAQIWQPDPANGTGYWPAFWMLGVHGWPRSGEIDILEDINALSTHSGGVHCGNLTHRNPDGTYGPCREGDGIGSGRLPCPGCQRGFRTYSVIIDRRDAARQQIRWYFEGREFFSVSEPRVGRAAWTAAFDHGLSIVLDVAVGGAYPDIVCRCVSPTARTSSGAAMTVRDLAVYVN